MSCSYTNAKNAFENYIDVDSVTIEDTNTKRVLDLNQVTESAKMQVFTLASNFQDAYSTQGFNKAQKMFSINFSEGRLTFNKEIFKEMDDFYDEEANPQESLDNEMANEILSDEFAQEDSWTDEDIAEYEAERESIINNPAIGAQKKAEIFKDPENFGEWRESMEAILDKAKVTRSRLKARKHGNRDKIREINKLINDLENEIADFEDSKVEVAYESVKNEVERIADTLNLSEEDPLLLAEILETNQIRERLHILSNIFNKYKNKDQPELLTIFYENLSPEEYNKISVAVTELENKLNLKMGEIIRGVITNNTYVQQAEILVKEEKGGEEKWERFIEKINVLLDENTIAEDVDGDGFLGLNFLGINSYNSIFTDIIGIIRDMNKSREAGITMQWKANLEIAYHKIRNKKINGKLITDMFFQLDDFGQMTNHLINPFSIEHFQSLREVRGYRGDFYRTSRRDVENKKKNYKLWMDSQKENTDFIDLTKIAKFANTHRRTPQYAEFFSEYNTPGNEAEYRKKMAEYEKNLRERLGNITFERLLEEQIRKAEDFLEDVFETFDEEYTKNPLRFIQHFYSESYNKPDSKGRFIIPHSDYITQLPKLDEDSRFNPEFLQLENSGIDGVKDFYINAKNILDYVRESGRAAGVSINHDSILNLSEELGRNAMEDLSTGKKIWAHTQYALKTLTSSMYEGRFENPEGDPNYSPTEHREFFSGYFDYGTTEANKLRELHMSYSQERAIQEAEKLGLTIPDQYRIRSNDNKRAIVEAIVRNLVNKSSSLDLLRRITTAARIAEDINTRLSTKGLFNIVRDYASKRNIKNTVTFLDTWGAVHLDRVGFIASGNKNLRKAERGKVKTFLGISTKKLTAAEKILRDALKAEEGNLTGKTFNFTFKGVKYSYNNETGEQIATSEEGEFPITREEVEIIYGEYVKDLLDNLGKHPTYGTIINGMAYNAYKAYLSYSPISGINNRMQGIHQNNQLAATRLYGFGNDELRRSRRFMTGYWAAMMAEYLPQSKDSNPKTPSADKGPMIAKRVEQWKILNHLARNLGYLDNVMEDIRGGEGRQGVIQTRNAWQKMKQFSSDFAMNIPESYNQLEILVSLFQTVTIKGVDEHGNEIESPIFNPETMEFVFEPGSMRLKKEFRTPENILNWEKFTLTEDGKSKQDIIVAKAQIFKNKTQGNYRGDDSPIFQASLTGKVSTMFMKWYFENLNNQYGKKEIDITTAMVDVKGRKIPLMAQAPTLVTYLALNNIGIFAISTNVYALAVGAASIGGLGGLVGSTAAVALSPVPIAGAIIGAVGAGIAIKRNWKIIREAKRDYKLSVAFLAEVGARTIKSSLATMSKFNPHKKSAERLQISDATINKWFKLDDAERWKDKMSLEDRALISATAQEVADKYHVYAMSALVQVALVGVAALLRLLSSDDEEEQEKLMERLKFLDKTMNMVLNVTQRQIDDLDQFSSPTATMDLLQMSALLNFMVYNSDERIKNSALRYWNGDIDFDEMLYSQSVGTLELVTGVPRKVTNLFKPDKKTLAEKMFTDDRIYNTQGVTAFSEYLASSIYTGEEKYKSLVAKKRNSVRGEIKRNIRSKVKEEAKKMGIELDRGQINSITNKYTEDVFRRSDAYVRSSSGAIQTNEQIYKNLTKGKIAKALRETKINIDREGKIIKKAAPKKTKKKAKSSSSRGGVDTGGVN